VVERGDDVSSLQGKVALITGAGSGIGRATATLFSTEGAKVVIAERDEDSGRDVEEQIRAGGGAALFIATDVTERVDIETVVSRTLECYGRHMPRASTGWSA
jgi:NAD(P)-dependent dehydrogenase (short-subunit alcohol dehydrogenase family)